MTPDPSYIVLPSERTVKYDGVRLTRHRDGMPWSAHVVRPRITATLSRGETPAVDFDLDIDIDIPHELRKQLLEMWADGVGYFAGGTLEADPVWCFFYGDDRAFARECERLGLSSEIR
jgi:hypothetical protein